MSMAARRRRRLHQGDGSPGDARRRQDSPQQQRRRLVLSHPARRVAVHVDFTRFLGSATPRDFDLRRFFSGALLDYSGGLPRSLRSPHHGHASTDGRAEPESVLASGRLPLENYASADQMTSMVKYPTDSSAPDQHGRATATRDAATFMEARAPSSTTAVLHVLPRTRAESFGYSTHSCRSDHGAVKELMNLNDKLTPLERRRVGRGGRICVAERRRFDAGAHARLDRAIRTAEADRDVRSATRGHWSATCATCRTRRQASSVESDDAEVEI